MNNNKRVAIIDLGTNTFHVQICEIENKNSQTDYQLIFKRKEYVKLASGGIGFIEAAAWQRGITTLSEYKTILTEHNVTEVYAFGTACLRTASNGAKFITEVKDKTGINIQLISGDKEAELIWKGVRRATNIGEQNALIVDIGGGSVEFIIANQTQIFWKQSFPIGAAVLKANYHKTDPITPTLQTALVKYFKDTLQPLNAAIKQYNCTSLIGASGSFDSIIDMQMAQDDLLRKESGKNAHDINYSFFVQLNQQLIKSTLAERIAIKGMVEQRAEMMVVACMLIEYVLKALDIRQIIQSEFALKQGMLCEIIATTK